MSSKKPAAKAAKVAAKAPVKKPAVKAAPAPKAETQPEIYDGQPVIYNPTPEQMEAHNLPARPWGQIETPQANGQFLLKLNTTIGGQTAMISAFYSSTVKPGTFQLA